MIRTAAIAAILAFTAANAASPLPPTTVTVRYPSAMTAVVKAADGKPLYRLVLRVDHTVDNLPTNLSLALERANAKPGADNLLEPPGNWHGYQPFFFAADDFKDGAEKSFHGVSREFCRDATGLETVITVKSVAVKPTPEPDTVQFNSLVLEVKLQSGSLVNGKLACP